MSVLNKSNHCECGRRKHAPCQWCQECFEALEEVEQEEFENKVGELRQLVAVLQSKITERRTKVAELHFQPQHVVVD